MSGRQKISFGKGRVLLGSAILLLLFQSAPEADLRMGILPTKLHLSLEPGASRTTTVEVSNNGEDPVRVVTYLADWTTPRDGGMSFLPPGELNRSASAWVDVDHLEMILPPHESQIVRVTATLPDTASGSYWTLIFFEGEGEIRRRAMGVGAKARMGTTVYITATGTETREDALTGMEIKRTPDSDTLQLVTSLVNRGNVYYYPEGWFQVLDPLGQILFEDKVPLRVLLPGRETVYRVPWQPESSGECRLVATFDSGLETLMQGVKQFVIPEPSEQMPAMIAKVADQPSPPEPEPQPLPDEIPPVSIAEEIPDTTIASEQEQFAELMTMAVAEGGAITWSGKSETSSKSDRLYGVHVESIATIEEVKAALRSYRKAKYPVTIKPVDLADRGTWYRIIFGRFAERKEASEFAKELSETRKRGFTTVVRLDP